MYEVRKMKRNEKVDIDLMVLMVNEFKELKANLSPLETHVLEYCFDAIKHKKNHVFFDDIQRKVSKDTKTAVTIPQVYKALDKFMGYRVTYQGEPDEDIIAILKQEHGEFNSKDVTWGPVHGCLLPGKLVFSENPDSGEVMGGMYAFMDGCAMQLQWALDSSGQQMTYLDYDQIMELLYEHEAGA